MVRSLFSLCSVCTACMMVTMKVMDNCKGKRQKLRRACHALSMCPSPWGGRVRDLPLLSSNEPVGRALPVP